MIRACRICSVIDSAVRLVALSVVTLLSAACVWETFLVRVVLYLAMWLSDDRFGLAV